MTTTFNNGLSVKHTGYSPLFAFNATVKALTAKGAELITNKSNSTNSYYIEGELNGNFIEIRFSNHSKALLSFQEREYASIRFGNLEGDIQSKDSYQQLKELISQF